MTSVQQIPTSFTKRYLTQAEAESTFCLSNPSDPYAYAKTHGIELNHDEKDGSGKEIYILPTPSQGIWIAKNMGASRSQDDWVNSKAEIIGRTEFDFFLTPDEILFTPEAYVYENPDNSLILLTRYLENHKSLGKDIYPLTLISPETRGRLIAYIKAGGIEVNQGSFLANIDNPKKPKLGVIDFESRQWYESYDSWVDNRNLTIRKLIQGAPFGDQLRQDTSLETLTYERKALESMLSVLEDRDRLKELADRIGKESDITKTEAFVCVIALKMSVEASLK